MDVSISGLTFFQARSSNAGQLLHAAHFDLKQPSSFVGQLVSLLVPGRVFLLKPVNQTVFQKPPKSAIQRSGAQHYSPAAHLLNVLHERITVTRPVRQAGQDKKPRLREWLALRDVRIISDMSHNAILRRSGNLV